MKVSICIPTYNQDSYVKQTILSAFNQTYPPFEIIVSDDCSTDNTRAVLESIKLEVPILKIIHQPVNLGISRNTNFCLRAATGDFVIRLDSDDYLLPQYIEKLANLLIENPTAGYAHADVQEIDKDGKYLRERRLARKPGLQPANDALKAAIKGYRVAANIIMFNRIALEKIGYITAKTDYVEDYHLSAEMAASGFDNVFTNEILSCYRVWLGAGKVRQRRKLMEIIGFRKVFEEVLQPAFEKRGWGLSALKNRKTNFVCSHAVCLTWDVYTKEEKAQLVEAFLEVSNTAKARLFVWLYLNGFGGIVKVYEQIVYFPKVALRKIFFIFNGNKA